MLTPRVLTFGRADDGSSLMLMPAAVLVVLLLAAIALDHSAVYLAHRELTDAAASAANDAAAFGIDPGSLRAGEHSLDRLRAEQAVLRSLAVADIDGLDPWQTTITVDPAAGTVTVTLTRHVDRLFAKALPGSADGVDVTVTGSARITER